MNKRTKITALLAIVLSIGLVGLGSTLAYFTDSKDAGNVVTLGHVSISLAETSDSDKAVEITPVGIDFRGVLPGDEISKIPTVTVDSGSAGCYIRMSMAIDKNADSTIPQESLEVLKTEMIGKITSSGDWAYNKAEDLFYFTKPCKAGDAVTFFKSVSIPSSWSNETSDQSFRIVLQAQAIQAGNITYDAVNACWADANGNDLTGANAVAIQEYTKQTIA